MYLGGYEKEEHAAEAYDMAALKTKGFDTVTNFSKDRSASLNAAIALSIGCTHDSRSTCKKK